MSSASLTSAVCIILLVLLAPGALGYRKFVHNSTGRQVLAKIGSTNVVAARDTIPRDRRVHVLCIVTSIFVNLQS